MREIDEIRPHTRLLVMDLVRESGIDVGDWANYRGVNPASNPKYCYEWAFVDRDKVVVLNLWFESMEEGADGRISQRMNYRKFAMDLERKGGHAVWARRARTLDMALQDAVRLKLPLRVIVNEGRREEIERDPDKASKVEKRALDPKPWNIVEYDVMTGDCFLVRGPATPKYVDQFSLPATDDSNSNRTQRTTDVFVRNAQVRHDALDRAGGFCEFCGEKGFVTTANRIYLETHHVIPLSEGGADSLANVTALCAGHHREAHHGKRKVEIRDWLLTKLSAGG